MTQHSKEKILDYLRRAEVAAVGTSSLGSPRQRMMHFAVDDDMNFYLTSMKGDPKVIQWSNVPETAILIHQGPTFMEMEECEMIGRAEVLKSESDRAIAIELLESRSPIVENFKEVGGLDRLEFIRVKPFTVKYRYVPEILQGNPPTVFDFPENRESVSVWDDMRSKAKAWKEAIRPLSLTASFVPILLGAALALSHLGTINWFYFLLTLIGGLMIQAGTNMINDWKDAERDDENRQGIRPFTGGSRMIQLGLIARADMGFFGLLLSFLALIIGVYLVVVSGLGILPLIAYGIIAGYFYTNGKGKFSFINMAPGVAEVIVATTYGVFMTMGAYYVLAGAYSLQVFLVSLPVALFISNVLVINQFPDFESDVKSDKKTLVVRLGKKRTKNILITAFVLGYVIIALLPIFDYAPYTLYVAFLSIPFALQAIRYAQKYYDQKPTDLIPSNAHTAINHLFNGLLLVFAYLLNNTNAIVAITYFVASLVLVFWVWKYIERQRKVMNDFRRVIQK